MWKKMPFLMLAKCAEALALRKAFPAELQGLYVKEEMDQAGPEHKPLPKPSEIMARLEAEEAARKTSTPKTGTAQTDGREDAFKAASMEPSVATHQQSSDASVLLPDESPIPGHGETMDQYVERHRVTLRTCERTPQAITHAFNAIPADIRQDVFQEYQAQLQSLNKAKKK
jgi:hypothetical protein